MRFNFACYAVCTVEIERDERGEIEEADAQLVGLWLSREDAEKAIGRRERARKESWERKNAEMIALWGWTYKPDRYEIVPVAELEFRSLDGAQVMIEDAASLQARGCGKEGEREPGRELGQDVTFTERALATVDDLTQKHAQQAAASAGEIL